MFLPAFLLMGSCLPFAPAPQFRLNLPVGEGEAKWFQEKSEHTDLYGDPLPEAALARIGTNRLRPIGYVHAVAFSPDGKMLASIDHSDHTLHLWDVATQKELFCFKPKPHMNGNFAFSRDSRMLAMVGIKLEVVFLDIPSGKELPKMPSGELAKKQFSGFGDLLFSADGKRLFVSDYGKVFVWERETGRLVKEWQTHHYCANQLALSANGKILLTRGASTALVWNLDKLMNATSRTPVIRLHGDKEPVVEVTGLTAEQLQALARLEKTPEKWPTVFAVYVQRGGDRATQPAMLGTYRVEKEVLRFEPRYPLVPGVSYRAVFHPGRLPGNNASSEKPVEKILLLPKAKPVAPTVVAHVYPSKSELPENQLKFYLHFSAPMSLGDSYKHIHLLRYDGKADERAFLELPQELWDHDGRRLTLFLDPGRVKRGLKPREDLGPVLEAARSYTLVIDGDWKDAEGNPLKATYRKTFRVLPLDETQPDPKKWKIEPPAAATKTPLVMTSPKALDRALLQRMLWITDDSGHKVPGEVEVSRQETCWRFTPTTVWKAGRYHLVADTRLEDLAGNSIGRLFEIDERQPRKGEKKTETVRIPFEVQMKP